MMDIFEEAAIAEEAERASGPTTGRSYLVADCGHSHTTVTLFEQVEGYYRLIGRGKALTTSGPPWYDLSRGLQQAISQISDATGRPLLNEQGGLIRPNRPDGAGVDEFGAVVSVGEPTRVLVAGLLGDYSIASARKALQAVYANEVDCFSYADDRDGPAQVMALLKLRPDIILLVGGTDGGADRQLTGMMGTLARGIELLGSGERPAILYAGNAALRPRVKAILGDLTDVYLAENVRPELKTERLDHTIGLLEEIHLADKVSKVPGTDGLQEWSTLPIKSTAHAFAGIAEFFAALKRGRVICVDVGSDQVTLAAVEPDKVDLLIRGDLGLGRPIAGLLADDDLPELACWQKSEADVASIQDFLLNKSLHPATTPMSDEDLRLELGIIRRILSQVVKDASGTMTWLASASGRQTKQLLLRGSALVDRPQRRLALLSVLDALQPTGIFEVSADTSGVLPAMGLLAFEDPEMVVQVLGSGALNRWGWVIVPQGRGRSGQPALRLTVQSEDLEELPMEVRFGELEIMPLFSDKPAEVTIQPAGGFDVGFGRGKIGKVTIRGGSIGLVVDARGRPLPSPADPQARRDLYQKWLQKIGA